MVRRMLSGWIGMVLASHGLSGGSTSGLWGIKGEAWSDTSRLPDYSFAGYRRGEKPIPAYAVTANVKAFGAKGDGLHDDTRAFNDAIRAATGGAILVPAGRYKITDFIILDKPGVVLRGVDAGSSVLWFPQPLNDIHPKPASTATGDSTTAYSFNYGFLTLSGDLRARDLAGIAGGAKRGDRSVTLAAASGLKAGQEVRIELREDAAQSLKTYLYHGDPGDIAKGKQLDAKFVAKVVAVDGKRIHLDRALPFDIRPAWRPALQSFDPTVRESGFESLGMEFPEVPYPGHFKEKGFNAIEMLAVADCWVRDIRIHNADMGVLMRGDAAFNTVSEVVLTANAGRGALAGHHAFQFKACQDNLVTGFDVRVPFVHDLSSEHASLNVYASGKGGNLNFDFHKDTPFANLYTDIDAGAGKRVWANGGGPSLGRPGAAWNTFWNIRAAADFAPPPAGWAPDLINVVAIRTASASLMEPAGKWIEAIPPAGIEPRNIHSAQLAARLAKANPLRRPDAKPRIGHPAKRWLTGEGVVVFEPGPAAGSAVQLQGRRLR